MSITLQLTHAGRGARYAAEPRGPDAPVLVGRGESCDVVVPSPAVSTQHAALFVHRGRWAVQDLRSRGGTTLNGERIDRPRHLRAGDRLSLGAGDDAPALHVVAVDEDAADRWVPLDVRVTKTSAAPAPAPAAPPAPIAAAEPAAVDWMAGDAVPPAGPILARRRAPVWPTALGLLVATAVVGGGAWWVYDANRDRPAAALPVGRDPAESPPPIDPAALGGSALFDAPAAGEPDAESPDVPESPPQATPSDPPATDDPGPPAADPAAQPALPASDDGDAAWARVLEASRMSPPRVALYLLIEYEASRPDARRGAEADAVRSAALDRLWWSRVRDLVERRAAARADAEAAEGEIVRTPLSEVGARADLIERRDAARSEAAQFDAALKSDMAYDADAPPPDDGPALDALRQARDPDRFADWSDRVVATLRRTNGGQLPWQ